MRWARTDINAETDIDRPSTVTYAWTPYDLGASLKAWWNADDHGTANMTDDGAGLISSWKDRINGVNCTGTTTARPTWAATSFNSTYAGLTFDGVANALGLTTVPASIPTGAMAGNLFALLNQVAVGNGRIINYGQDGANARTLGALSSGGVRLQAGTEAVGLTDTAAIFSGNSIIGGEWAGTLMSAWLNGTPTTPATAAIASLATAVNALKIGARAQTAALFGKGVFRHLFVTLQLTTLQRQQLEGWMAWDAGLAGSLLSVGHPYKAAAPTITRSWSPRDLGTALKAWWSADDHGTGLMTDDGAGLISSWTDRVSGIAVTGTTTARPTWGAASFNSAYPGLTFDGVANSLVNAAVSTLPSGAAGSETWAVVNQAALVGDATQRVTFSYGGWSSQTRRHFRISSSGIRVCGYATGILLTDTSVSYIGNHIAGFCYGDGAFITGRINGSVTSPASVALGSLTTTANSKLAIGSGNDTVLALFWQGLIRHIIVTTGPLTALQRQQLEGYLAWDSGLASLLPAGHPYKAARP